MAFTSIGYDGTVNELQWAALVPSVGSSTYGVMGAGDLKVTAVPGQPLMVSVAAGTAWGHGVMDTEVANTTITCDAITSGTRYDLITVRRDWQPLAGGPTSIAKVTGTGDKVIPGAREDTPGVIDDQPLALVQWTAGQTQPTSIIDLRCWAGNGGMVASDTLALSYLAKLGASVTVAGVTWNYVPGANDVASWVKASENGRIALFGHTAGLDGGTPPAGTLFLDQRGTVSTNTNGFGSQRLTWPKPFPNGLLSFILMNGDSFSTGAGGTIAPAGGSGHGSSGGGDRTSVVYEVFDKDGNKLLNHPHRVSFFATGW